jgi:two-component system cell cycle sensor histidine kinase/response regulator CckA
VSATNLPDEPVSARGGGARLRSPAGPGDARANLRLLTEVAHALHSEPDLRRLLDAVLDRVVDFARAERGFLVLRKDARRLTIAASRNMDRRAIPQASSAISRAIVLQTEKAGRPVLSTNAQEDPRFAGSESVAHMKLRAVLCVPLSLAGRSLGVLYLDNRFEEGVFRDVDMGLIEAFAVQAALAIEHATYHEKSSEHAAVLEKEIAERKRAEKRLETQNAVARLLGEAGAAGEIVPAIVRTIAGGIGWDAGGAWEADDAAGVLRCTHFWHAGDAALEALAQDLRGRTFPKGDGMPGRVWASRAPEWCDDIAADPLHPRAAAAAAGLRAAVAFPVAVGGEVRGVVAFLSKKAVPRDADLLAMMGNVGAQFGQFVERKREEKARTDLEAIFRQAQKMDAIGRLAGGVAHDFNNLLTIIMGCGYLAKTGLKPGDPAEEHLAQVEEAALRASALTRQLLAFSRQQVLTVRLLDLNEVVQGMEKMLRRLLGEDIDLEVALHAAPGCVRADPGQMEQVLLNFAVNARDAMPSGGRLVIQTAPADLDAEYLKTRAPECRPGRYVALTVSDSGTGIAPDVIARIFEPFFTTKDVGKGTGLGLATVYGIVQQSGGLVSVYSEPGHGATFKVFLPRVAAADAPPTEGIAIPAPPRGTERILLVEDDPQLRELSRKLLETQGYRVQAAADADAAVALAGRGEQGRFDLLVTDIVMPRVDGFELARRMQALRPGIRVLYTSGYTGRILEGRGGLDAMANFIEKPFTADIFAHKVRQVLDAPIPTVPPAET